MCPTQWATLNEPWTAMFQTWQPATSTYVVFKSSAGYNWCTGIVKHVAANIFAHYVCADVTRELRATVMSPFFHVNLEKPSPRPFNVFSKKQPASWDSSRNLIYIRRWWPTAKWVKIWSASGRGRISDWYYIKMPYDCLRFCLLTNMILTLIGCRFSPDLNISINDFITKTLYR